MTHWLFIWNPSRWAWDSAVDGYNELRLEIEQNGYTFLKWSCGVNRSIQKGDRIFLMRLGCPNRGIVASGYAETVPFEGTHWDAEKAAKGIKARRIYIRVDRITDIDGGEYLP